MSVNEASVERLATVPLAWGATESHPIYEIWGGMIGKIWVLHSPWNKERVREELVRGALGRQNSTGGGDAEMKLSDEQVCAVIDAVAKYGSFITEGDLIALDHVLSILRCLYPPEDIGIMNSWHFGQSEDDVRKHSLFKKIMQDNVVLVCGPVANLPTRIFLEGADLGWLFKGHTIRVRPDDATPLTAEGEVGSGKPSVDYGIFLRCQNPFNRDKRVYAAAGAYAFGTQGAAAFGCSEPSAAELILATRRRRSELSGNVDYIGWVKVWKRPFMMDFSDRHIKYQLLYPKPSRDVEAWAIHDNPSSIVDTFARLKAAVQEGIVFLGCRTSVLLVYTFMVVVVTLATYMLLWGSVAKSILSMVLVVASAILVRLLISLLMPPVKRNIRRMGRMGRR